MPFARTAVCGLLAVTVAVLFLAAPACNDPAGTLTPARSGPATHDHSGHDHGQTHTTSGSPSVQPATAKQTLCPIMGEEIDASVSVVHEGRKVYFCCEDCIDTFKKDPAKYLAKL